MSHEWECATRYGVYNLPDCICDWLRAAYQRGRQDAAKDVETWIEENLWPTFGVLGSPDAGLVEAAQGESE